MPCSIWLSAQRHWSLSNMHWVKTEVTQHTVVRDYRVFPDVEASGIKREFTCKCPHLTKAGLFPSCVCQSSADQGEDPKQTGSSAQQIITSSLHRDASLGTQRDVWRKPRERLCSNIAAPKPELQRLKWNLLEDLSWVYFIKVDTNFGLELGILLPLLQYSAITLCIRISH